jgi:nucleoside-diphosphate-sugar epimerase
LINLGWDVTELDNFRHGDPSLSHLCWSQSLGIVRGDARCVNDVGPLAQNADVIIPLAALVGVAECERDTVAAETTNLEAIQLLCDVAPARARIIFPNTNSGYGISGEPICTEESPLMPISLYGQTKCAAERYVLARGNCTVFRLATVFGMSPRMRWDLMVNNFVWRAVKERAMVIFEPEFRRNFIHVRDVARAFAWALDRQGAEVFNLGLDSANLTKAKLAELIGCTLPNFTYLCAQYATDPDKRDYFVSNEKIREAGFEPIWGLDRGIGELIKGAQQYAG